MGEPLGFHELLQRAQSGERAALEDLMAEFGPLVRCICFDYEDAAASEISTSDRTQEVWMRVLIKLHQFQGADDDELTKAKFRSWLRKITRTVLVNLYDAHRAKQRQPPGQRLPLDDRNDDDSLRPGGLAPVDDDLSPSARVCANDQAERLHHELNRIPAQEREILRLRFFEDLSLRQISEVLNETYDRVRARFRKSLELLQLRMEDSV
jgi:RNA polymerase sigma-70 factor (ECF subfamily)